MNTSDFLFTMARSSRARSAASQQQCGSVELRALIKELPSPPRLQRSNLGFDLIAEIKLRSPATGQLSALVDENLADRARVYAEAGAAAVSVLTEPSRFDGTIEHLILTASALAPLQVPVMRKDFLVDAYQVLEARAAGAGGVLVILRMLERNVISEMIDTALGENLFILLEAFDENDLILAKELLEARRSCAQNLLLGINCRDLISLQVIPNHLEKMAKYLPQYLPAGIASVAESGVTCAEDAARMASAGYDLALVGGALMSDVQPASLAAAMLTEARKAVAARTVLTRVAH
ncbi:MAG: indole-3-glycerol-phosphate synthase [Gammaproteobacteria bacterium]|nr:indole-3-glycerol-phosphate synthase [Gammaproteobacteria bacterium]